MPTHDRGPRHDLHRLPPVRPDDREQHPEQPIERTEALLATWPASRELYLPPPAPGKLFRSPTLAATYRRILDEDPEDEDVPGTSSLQPGVPDTANGASYAVTNSVFECVDALDDTHPRAGECSCDG